MCTVCGCLESCRFAAVSTDAADTAARLEEVVNGTRWGPGVLGQPGGVVTWSIAPAGTILGAPSFLPEEGAAVDGQAAFPFDIEEALREAFAVWSAVADIEFVQIEDGGGNFFFGPEAAIRIAHNEISDDLIGAAQPPPTPFFGPFPGDAAQGNIVLDPTIAELAEARGLTERELYLSLAIHEIGHAAIGLDHSPLATSIMQPTITRKPGLDPEDVLAAQTVYGAQTDAAPRLRLDDLGETDFTMLYGPDRLIIEGTRRADRIETADGNETLSGGAGDDTLAAGGGDDRLVGGAGGDRLDGGAGDDMAVFAGERASYEIAEGPETILTGPDGEDRLLGIERLLFDDLTVFLDDRRLSGEEARAVAFLYGAAFDREPDAPGLNFWIDQREAGLNLFEIAAFMTNEPGGEFEQLYGPIDSLAVADFVERLYLNTLDRVPEDGGFDYWVSTIEAGLPRHHAVFYFSNSPEYQANNDALISTLEEAEAGIWTFG